MRSLSDEVQNKITELARATSVGVANAKATGDIQEVRLLLTGYEEDTAALGVPACHAWSTLASASMWWMAELTRVLAAERGRDITEEFEEMGRIAAGVMP